MAASSVRAGSAYVEIGADPKAFYRALDGVTRSIANVGRDLQSIGSKLAAVGGGAVAGMVAATKAFSTAGSTLLDLSKRTGVSVEALSAFGYAAEQSGATLEDVSKGIVNLNREFVDAAGGSQSAQKAFSDLGVEIADLARMTPEQRFMAIVGALAAIPDPAVRAALAMKLFGKNGLQLLPMIADGTAGIREMTAEAERLGLVMATEDAKAANAFGSAVNSLVRSIGAVNNAIGAALAPTLTDIANAFAASAATVTRFLQSNQPLVQLMLRLSGATFAAGLALVGIGKVTLGISNGLKGLAGILSAVAAPLRFVADVSTVFGQGLLMATQSVIGFAASAIAMIPQVAATMVALLGPFGAVVAAIAAVGAGIAIFSNLGSVASSLGQSISGAFSGLVADAKVVFGDLYSIATTAFGGISDALAMGDLQSAGEMLWLGLQAAWQRGIQGVMSYVDPFVAEVQNTFTYFAAGIATTWERIASESWQTVNTMAAVINGVFDNMTNAVMATWDTLESGIRQSWNYIQSFFTKGFDLEAENAKVRDEMSARARQRELESPGIEGRREQAAAENISAEQAATQRIDAIRRGAYDTAQARFDENRRRADARQSAAAETQARMGEKRQEIAAQRVAYDAAADDRRKRLEQLGTEGGGGMTASKAEAAGTFSSVALGGLGFGSNLAERTARAAEETAKGVKQLVSQGADTVGA
jgi:hypothetical protein